ncbi:MAG: hypothetical protein ABJB39_05815 [Chloroflexota bacterium]
MSRRANASTLLIAAGWLALVAGIGWLDEVTGPNFGFGFFYLLAILPAAWYGGRATGVVVAAAASIAWFAADAAVRPSTPISAVAWNAASRSFLFFAAALLVDRLRHDRAELVETNTQRGRFLRVLERELPRPAVAHVQALDRLLKVGTAGTAELQQLRRDAEGMLFLARDFVALGQLQSGDLSLVRRSLELRSLIPELVRERADQARILVTVHQQQPTLVSADPARLGQAITAMLDEAGASVNEDIRVDVDRSAGDVRVTVSAGAGPDDTMLRPALDDERLVGFELARLIIEAHGGTLLLSRRPVSRGLRAVFTLPLSAEEVPPT